MRRFIDIGANLTDPQFRGVYHGKRKHDDDFVQMMERARTNGVEKMLVTGSCLAESKHAIALAEQYPGVLYATVGVHPCSAKSVPQTDGEREAYWAELETVARNGAAAGIVPAFGEFGLDYDRLHYASKECQIRAFEDQLEIATRVKLPLFLHSRACARDFSTILNRYLSRLPKRGVVHSFTGTADEAAELIDMGFCIGVNGCSLKTEENLAVVKLIPLDKLMLETDGPWCEIRPSHASFKHTTKLPYTAVKPEKYADGCMVRGRCEPCSMQNVAEVVAAVKELSVDEVAEAAYANTKRVFGMD